MYIGIEREPTAVELLELAREVSPWWKDVARCLHPCVLSEQEILGIEEKYRYEGVVSQCFAMLQAWHRQYGSDGTVLQLCEASLKARRRLAAEKVFGRQIVGKVYFATGNQGTVLCSCM